MRPNVTTIERAFELAHSGEYTELEAIVRALKTEGYDDRQIEGKQLRKELREKMRSAGQPK